MFERLRRWLGGSFICTKCGKNYQIFSFGFGDGICPNCYDGEKQFLFFDNSFSLNRVLNRLLNRSSGVKRVNRDRHTTNFLVGTILTSITFIFARDYSLFTLVSCAFMLEGFHLLSHADTKIDLIGILCTIWGGLVPLIYLIFWTLL